MKKSYYLFNPGRLSRKDNTLCFTPIDEDGNEGQPKYLPVEDVSTLYVFGNLDANSAMYNFLAKYHITVHFFDYYEHYTGSFMPREYLLSGKMLVSQVSHHTCERKRLVIAKKFVEGAVFNLVKNLRYYANRGKELEGIIAQIEEYNTQIATCTDIAALMGIEGNVRNAYYGSFDLIISEFDWRGRQKQPPPDEINALISFGNMLCYTTCLDQIYHTQLNPTISFLHQSGERRFSLCLDISEIFKPILVDRLVFRMLNKKELQAKDFRKDLNSCLLTEEGRKKFVKAWDERLKETIAHRTLKKHVSYKHLIKLECYKLAKHLLGIEEYKPFKAWW